MSHFQVLNLQFNFSAKTIAEITPLSQAMTEPPLVMDLTDQEVRGLVYKPLSLGGLPCHTQQGERGVKITSESSQVSIYSDLYLANIYICRKSSQTSMNYSQS